MINTGEKGVQINLTNFVQFSAFIFSTVNETELIMKSHIYCYFTISKECECDQQTP